MHICLNPSFFFVFLFCFCSETSFVQHVSRMAAIVPHVVVAELVHVCIRVYVYCCETAMHAAAVKEVMQKIMPLNSALQSITDSC